MRTVHCSPSPPSNQKKALFELCCHLAFGLLCDVLGAQCNEEGRSMSFAISSLYAGLLGLIDVETMLTLFIQ